MDVLSSGVWSLDRWGPVYLAGTARLESFRPEEFKVAQYRAVPQSTYNQILYETVARFAMHPDRMAAVARLFGMHSAPVDGCRYLEIGCGNGSHIVGLAYHLPQSRFVGVDLAEVPIAAGERMRAALDIGNLTLRLLLGARRSS
jgi:tRNA G46 methylase TrmB